VPIAQKKVLSLDQRIIDGNIDSKTFKKIRKGIMQTVN